MELVPLPRAFQMPEKVEGSQQFKRGGVDISIQCAHEEVHLIVEAASVGGQPLKADLRIQRPSALESLNVVVPWNEKTFQFTSKQHCLPAEGQVRWGSKTFDFSSASSFACLDYGRGIWPFSTSWNWAAFSARAGADTVGVNMGARWTDGTGMNENGILLNGKQYKVFSDMTFDYNPADLMAPWHLRTKQSEEIDLVFRPFYHRKADTNLGILRTNVSQMIGRYTGTVRAPGKSISVGDVPGWAEEHFARW